MKIIYIANARIPTEKAHGIQIMKMCESFALGNELELILPRRLNKVKAEPFSYYGMAKTFKITKLPCVDLIPFSKHFGNLGLWVESLTFFFPAFFYVIFKKADLIYTRDKFILPLILFRKNLIFEAHTFPNNYFLYSFFLKRLKGVVVITQKLKGLFLAKGVFEARLLTAPDGVDTAMFAINHSQSEAREKLGLVPDRKIILYTGHLYKWKGVGVLLEAARKFSIDNYQFSNYLFIFVGGTEKDIASFKRQAGNLNNVLIIGHRLYSEIPFWLKAADVLVLPNSGQEEISKSWTSPMKAFEYMAAQRPIVASDLPSIREILNEQNAILVEPDNPQDLARGIKTALEDKALSWKVAAQAFQEVQNYTWQKRVQKIYEYFSVGKK